MKRKQGKTTTNASTCAKFFFTIVAPRCCASYHESQYTRKQCSAIASDSVKCNLPIEHAADLTPVVAGEEAGASWNARGIEKTVDFWSRKEYSVRASGRSPGKIADTTKARHGGSISWCWTKPRGTSRRSAWPAHERCRIFGGHGCGLGGGRRPGTGYRPETGSWSAPPGRWFGGPRGV